MKTIAISVEETDLSRLDQLAGQHGKRRNRSLVVRRAIREYFSRLERLAEEERELEIYRRNRKQLRREAAALMREQVKL
jgi:metal-responsive CopG/Arc/MetJ family transcriptional regulator